MTNDVLLKAYRLMLATRHMALLYDANRAICKYVHSTSLGHQAVQAAAGLLLTPQDFVSPYYRDECMLLAMGFTPYQLMLQLLAKADDPFSGGRSYYGHPSSKQPDRPGIIHQSSATGMQLIPATGLAEALKFKAQSKSLVLCSLGDASLTEGEVSEALQVAALKQLPIVYLVQDNGWGISVSAKEARTMSAVQFAQGFPGINAVEIDGTDFETCFEHLKQVFEAVKAGGGPWLVQANVALLGHHTSGVRKEFYRSAHELAAQELRNPIGILRHRLLEGGHDEALLDDIENEVKAAIAADFEAATNAAEPDAESVENHVFAPTAVQQTSGVRCPLGAPSVPMVDAALFAIRELMAAHPEALLYGQDVGRRLGGVFREAATLAEQFGDKRVFNTAIHEAYIVGSTAGMSAAGLRPIVEVQFADYVWPGLNQLVSEISKSCYLSMGKYPVSMVLRVPCGAYGGGGPYHSGSIETTLLSIKGIKVVYPSNAADMKGLMKAAFYDPNPVVMLEHKGLYWSKVPGTEAARCPEPDADYVVPLGQGRTALAVDEAVMKLHNTCCVITYGMGVHWALAAAAAFAGRVEVIDLRTLMPLDEALVFATVRKHGRCLVLTEEPLCNSFAEALAGRISQHCFTHLDAPVMTLGALNLPAVPINTRLEAAMLPSAQKTVQKLDALLSW
ncbi:MAG: tungsten formylmethanofuran dehydrogenase [Bacteroidetes bacterium]|nr:MAG: tungsten formylmethanofuran dehydrogenase [Bacteroidota bacterium]